MAWEDIHDDEPQWANPHEDDGQAHEQPYLAQSEPGGHPAEDYTASEHPARTGSTYDPDGYGQRVDAQTPHSTDDGNPFGGVERVDPLVYSDQTLSPELQWQQQSANVPLPPVRERPRPPMPERAEPWKPGPDPVPTKTVSDSRATELVMAILVPLMVLGALGWLVYQVAQAYRI